MSNTPHHTSWSSPFAVVVVLAWLALAPVASADENLISVEEQFYRLTQSSESGEYERTPVNEARPGELLELQITAINSGPRTARNIDLINSVPTDATGRSLLLADSFLIDESQGEIRLSRNGNTFFPVGVEMSAEEVRFVQWLVFSLRPNEQVELRYRLTIPH